MDVRRAKGPKLVVQFRLLFLCDAYDSLQTVGTTFSTEARQPHDDLYSRMTWTGTGRMDNADKRRMRVLVTCRNNGWMSAGNFGVVFGSCRTRNLCAFSEPQVRFNVVGVLDHLRVHSQYLEEGLHAVPFA